MEDDKDMMLTMILLKHQFDFIYAEKVKPYGVTFIQAVYMKAIHDSETVITMSMLAKLFGVTRARVTTVLKGVREAGYLVEEHIDGRAISLGLTEKGKEVVQHFNKLVQEDHNKIFSMLTPDEFQTMKKVLSKASEYFSATYGVN